MGSYTGAAEIFGSTGGVMEAAIRTVHHVVTGEELPRIVFQAVRGFGDLREAEVDLAELGIAKVAVVHGLRAAARLLAAIRTGEASYAFVEVMGCPGGCLGGGGQPIPTNKKIREARARAIYDEDRAYAVRKSHENPAIVKIYQEYLTDGPCGHRSHELLHTHYTPRGKYIP
jgi:iron only hydrogenase large subunit-like protein